MPIGVAMLASDFWPSVGGIQTHTLRLSRALRGRGIDAVVVTRHWPGLPRYEVLDSVPVHRVGTPRGGRAVSTLTYIGGALRLLAAERARLPVLHAHQMLSPMTIALAARAMLGSRVVVQPHLSGPAGDVQLLRRHRALTGRARVAAAVATADAFISISAEIGEELAQLGVPATAVWNVPNGVDTAHFAPLPTPRLRTGRRRELGMADGRWVVYTGRLAHQKGVDVLLAAWPRVAAERPDARLLIVGCGEQAAALRAQAEGLVPAGTVRFAEPHADVAPLLQAADVFVLPSRSEGMPLALLEAMASELPVVATAVGGTREVVEDGVSGRLVPPHDAGALAAALVEALTPGPAGAWGAAARRRVQRSFSLDRVVDQHVALYASLASARGRAPVGSPVRAARR